MEEAESTGAPSEGAPKPSKPKRARNPRAPAPAAAGEVLDKILSKHMAKFTPVRDVARNLAADLNTLDEPDPEKRAQSTFEGGVRDDSDDVIRTFDDMMSRYPVSGDGQFYIHVERKEPKHWQGVFIRGVQAPIRMPMNFSEFEVAYGGGEYLLTAYGTPQRGKVHDGSGKPLIKALTKPIRVVVPLTLPPNVNATVPADVEEEMNLGVARSGMATNADARIREVELNHEREVDGRRRNEDRERQTRLEQSERGRLDASLEATRIIKEQAGEALSASVAREQALMQQVTELRQELLEATRTAASHVDPEALRRVEQSLRDAVTAHGAELSRVQDAHRAEVSRINEQHRAEVDRVRAEVSADRERNDIRAREVEQRAATQIKEAEERANNRIREVESRAQAEINAAHNAANQRVVDLQGQHAQRIEDERRSHDRDLRAAENGYNLKVHADRGSLESQIALKDAELTRMRAELSEAREKANQPLSERIAEITETAEALGMRPAGDGEDPKDWKSMAFQVGANLVGQLPELVKNAGEVFRASRAPANPAFAQRQQAGMVQSAQDRARALGAAPRPPMMGPPVQSLGFATEDGPTFRSAPVGRPVVSEAPAQPLVAPIPIPAAPLAAEAPASPPVSEAPPAAASDAPAAALVPAPEEEVYSGLPTDQVVNIERMLAAAMQQGVPPDEVAKQLTQMFGIDAMRGVIVGITPQQIQAELRRAGLGRSPLCRRDGQKFVQDLWKAAKTILK